MLCVQLRVPLELETAFQGRFFSIWGHQFVRTIPILFDFNYLEEVRIDATLAHIRSRQRQWLCSYSSFTLLSLKIIIHISNQVLQIALDRLVSNFLFPLPPTKQNRRAKRRLFKNGRILHQYLGRQRFKYFTAPIFLPLLQVLLIKYLWNRFDGLNASLQNFFDLIV
jgi:hypothetical protein